MYNLEPITEREKILANMAGRHYEVHPRTREESFLQDIAELWAAAKGGNANKRTAPVNKQPEQPKTTT